MPFGLQMKKLQMPIFFLPPLACLNQLNKLA